MVEKARKRVASSLVLASLLLCSAGLHAQARRPLVPDLRNAPHVGVGYLANIPNTALGFSVLGTTPKLFGGAGLHANVKLTTGSPGDSPHFLPAVSVEQAELDFGDQFFQDESDWLTINLALVYAINGSLAVYGGAGYAKEDRYREYFDDLETRGDNGFYWVSDPDGSGTRVNVLGGMFFRLAKAVFFQLGAETAPPGANAGVTFAFPF